MQRKITRGAAAGAGLIFHVFAMDSASTTGAGKASVAYSSFSCRYIRNGEAISGAITAEDITTIGTYAAPTANTNIRIKAVDNTNMIGVYEVQIHADWVNTTNTCQSLTIFLTATGVAALPIQIPLVADDAQVAKPTNSQLLSIDSNGRIDVIKVAGTTQTARDLGASVLLSSGTGAGQLDFTSGVVKANLAQILGTAITETAGQIAAAFTKFFNKASPTGTVNSLPDAVPGAAGGVFIAGSNAATTLATLTVTGLASFADGVSILAATTNRIGLMVSGNGSGPAMQLNAGATGIGLDVNGGATSGAAATFDAPNDNAVMMYGIGASSLGLWIRGDAGGGVIQCSDNGIGLQLTGSLDNGLTVTGVHGAAFIGAAGHGIYAIGDSAAAIRAEVSGGNAAALSLAGLGSGNGFDITPGATGVGIRSRGGATSGDAASFTGTAGNARGMLVQGQGSNDGLEITGGVTGIGVDVNGGSTSGAAITVDAISGNGITVTGGDGSPDVAMLLTGGLSVTNGWLIDGSRIADLVWDASLVSHLISGSTGAALNAAGAAGDPWSTALPGAYGSGTAGKIVGDNINATISSRATQTSVDDVPTNAELATALGAADDATLAAISALSSHGDSTWSTASGFSTHSAADVWAVTARRLSAAGIDDILDEVVEGSYTLRQYMRGFAAAMLGKASGLDTTNALYRDTADSKDRIDATVDADGNRTAVTLDLT